MSPETIDAMLAAGATAEVIAAAWKAEIVAQSRAVEGRRAKDRERQRRKRGHVESRGVTRTGRDTADPAPNDNNLTPTRDEKTEPKGSSKKFILPADIPPEPWNAFERMRMKIRKPMTDDARWLAVGKLRKLRDEDGWPPGDVLNHCTLNSYQGIYPPNKARQNDIGKSAAAYASLVSNLAPDEPF